MSCTGPLVTFLSALAGLLLAVVLNFHRELLISFDNFILTATPTTRQPPVLRPVNQPTTSKVHPEYYQRFRNDDPEQFQREYEVIGTIEKEQWSIDKPLQQELLNSKTPRVLQNTFVSQWDAFTSTDPTHKWDLNSVEWRSRLSKVIAGVYHGETPYFGPLFRLKRPLHTPFPHISNPNPFTIKGISTNDFFQHVLETNHTKTADHEQFLYYTGGLNSPQIAADIQPFDELLPSEEDISINVWVGAKGVVTHAHVDASENFFVQVQGSKRFVIWSPDQMDNAYLFPSLHPSYGQAQIFPVNPPNINYQLERFPNASKIKAYEVVLHPGDLLFLPTTWFHQVYTLESSISVNFWSRSFSTTIYTAALKTVADNVISDWSIPQRRLATSFLIQSILAHPQVRDRMKVWGDEVGDSKDLDPFDLKKKFKSALDNGDIKQKDGDKPITFDSNNIPSDSTIWTKFIESNAPIGKLSKTLTFDNYTQRFFTKYLDSRYANSFRPNMYSSRSEPDFTMFPNTTAITTPEADAVKWDFFDNFPNQQLLSQKCQFGSDFEVQSLTPESYMRLYQGAGLLATQPYRQYMMKNIDKPIDNEAYITMLFDLAQQTANLLKQLPPGTRPLHIANLIELWAKWSDHSPGLEVPSLMYCFKHAQINLA